MRPVIIYGRGGGGVLAVNRQSISLSSSIYSCEYMDVIPSPLPRQKKLALRPSRRSTTTGYERHMQICSSVVFRGNQGTKPIFPVSHGAGVSLMSSCERLFDFSAIKSLQWMRPCLLRAKRVRSVPH